MRPTFPDFTSTEWLRSARMGLLILAISTFVRGIFYLPRFIPPEHGIPPLEFFLPQHSWVILWCAAGLFAAGCVVFRLFIPLAISLCTGLHALWGFFYIGSWIFDIYERGFITAWSYITVVVLCMWAFGRGQTEKVSVKEA